MGKKPVSYETRNLSRRIGGEGMLSIVMMCVCACKVFRDAMGSMMKGR